MSNNIQEFKTYWQSGLRCFVTKNNIYVLELNPRFGGGYPFTHEAGAHISAMYIEWLNGGSNVEQFNNYKDGLAFSKCDRMMKINQ